MKPAPTTAAAAAVILLIAGVALVHHRGTTPPPNNGAPAPAAPAPAAPMPAPPQHEPAAAARPPSPAGAREVDPRFERLADGRSILRPAVEALSDLHSDLQAPQHDLEALDAIFGLYRWAFGEVPEGGENRELLAALTGDNPKRLVFFPPDHGSLDDEGALLDRWGTPYFFHKLSDQVVDVTSAGPDRRLWSADDLTLGHTAAFQAASPQALRR